MGLVRLELCWSEYAKKWKERKKKKIYLGEKGHNAAYSNEVEGLYGVPNIKVTIATAVVTSNHRTLGEESKLLKLLYTEWSCNKSDQYCVV
jgi:hypothetical protein